MFDSGTWLGKMTLAGQLPPHVLCMGWGLYVCRCRDKGIASSQEKLESRVTAMKGYQETLPPSSGQQVRYGQQQWRWWWVAICHMGRVAAGWAVERGRWRHHAS